MDYLRRFGRIFIKRASSFLYGQGLIAPSVGFIAGLVCQYVTNHLSLQSLRTNSWQSLFLYIVCGAIFALLVIGRSARDLNRELTVEKNRISVLYTPDASGPTLNCVRAPGYVFGLGSSVLVLSFVAMAFVAAYPAVEVPYPPASPAVPTKAESDFPAPPTPPPPPHVQRLPAEPKIGPAEPTENSKLLLEAQHLQNDICVLRAKWSLARAHAKIDAKTESEYVHGSGPTVYERMIYAEKQVDTAYGIFYDQTYAGRAIELRGKLLPATSVVPRYFEDYRFNPNLNRGVILMTVCSDFAALVQNYQLSLGIPYTFDPANPK